MQNRKRRIPGRKPVNQTPPSADQRAKPGRATIKPGQHVSRSEWERIFGPETERQAKFREALEKQRASREAGGDLAASGAAIHGENKGAGRRLYGSPHRGVWDDGLGCQIYGRSDRARKARELGLRPAR